MHLKSMHALKYMYSGCTKSVCTDPMQAVKVVGFQPLAFVEMGDVFERVDMPCLGKLKRYHRYEISGSPAAMPPQEKYLPTHYAEGVDTFSFLVSDILPIFDSVGISWR